MVQIRGLENEDSLPLLGLVAGKLGQVLFISHTAGEQGGNNFNDFRDFCTEDGSYQGYNLALTGLFVASSLQSGSVLISHDP